MVEKDDFGFSILMLGVCLFLVWGFMEGLKFSQKKVSVIQTEPQVKHCRWHGIINTEVFTSDKCPYCGGEIK